MYKLSATIFTQFRVIGSLPISPVSPLISKGSLGTVKDTVTQEYSLVADLHLVICCGSVLSDFGGTFYCYNPVHF